MDRHEPNTSSRIAAGLVTPITGSRGAASWRWDDFYPAANRFYQAVEQITRSDFWRTAPAYRVFVSAEQRDLFDSRWMNATQPMANREEIAVAPISFDSSSGIQAPWGACSLEPAARLDTLNYLQATETFFSSIGCFTIADVDCDDAIQVTNTNVVSVASLQLFAPRVVLCQGIYSRQNRFFESLPLHPARGDMLRVASNTLKTNSVIHGDAWSVPLGDNQYLVGATYDRSASPGDSSHEDGRSLEFRSQLMKRFEAMTTGSFAKGDHYVVGQRSAVRPASYDRHPLIGRHQVFPNVYCLNGLGSKGALMSPHLAWLLLDAMQGAEIPNALDWNRRR